MNTLEFSININAPKAKVWDTLWNDTTYRQWTKIFFDGSYAETDWEEGSKILFLSPQRNGMYGVIEKIIPNEQMVFRHLGEVKNGVAEPKATANASESYYLQEHEGSTELRVVMEATGDAANYFSNTFPKALQLVKEIAEQ